MTDPPPTLAWVRPFVESLHRAFLGGWVGWELKPDVDPLKWVLHLRFQLPLRREEVPFIRDLLSQWADANDAVYRRSEWKGQDFHGLLYIKGLKPEKNINPFASKEDTS